MKLHSTLISGALVTAVAAEERRPRNNRRLRNLKVNIMCESLWLCYLLPLYSLSGGNVCGSVKWCYYLNSWLGWLDGVLKTALLHGRRS